MPTCARREIVAEGEVAIYHCTSRCVRRAFLCGFDPYSNRDFEHRKQWVSSRLEELAAAFAIDVCSYAVMSNHLHVILRTRSDVVRQWSDEEIARRWLQLHPLRWDENGSPAEPKPTDLSTITSDTERLRELRRRLSSISWFMAHLNEHIARRANAEDEVKGRFWEGRFHCQRLLDEAAVLACSVYVDLNPIRAGVADRPERSKSTSIHDRIRSLKSASKSRSKRKLQKRTSADRSQSQRHDPAAWLAPVNDQSDQHTLKARPDDQRRASDRGFLPLSLPQYVQLVDWTGRQFRPGKRGRVSSELPPILQRLQLDERRWLQVVSEFRRLFHRAAGRVELMTAAAEAAGKCWFHGVRACHAAFG